MSSLTGKSLNPVMNRRSVIASAAGLGAMSILAGCSSNGGDSGSASGDASFKIGTIGPLTGAAASYGKSVTQGVELGCKDFSTKELPLASKAEDDQADGEKAVNAFNTCSTGACRPLSARPPRVRRLPLPQSAVATPRRS